MIEGSTPEIRALAQVIDDLRRQVRALSRGSGAAFRSVELGDGQPKYYEPQSPTPIGEVINEDGVPVIKPVQPPPPPVPTQPIVESAIDGINVKWDGTFIGANRPANLRYIEIHVSFDANFQATDATQVGSMVSAFGGSVFIRRPPEDGPVWVGLTTVDTFGQESAMSSTAEGEPLSVELPGPVEPTDAPVVVVAPLGIGGVIAAWDPVPDAETYEVFVSTAPIIAFDATELLGEGPATSIAIGMLPNGSDLPYQTIYVRVRAKSAAGTGPASVQVSTVPNKATGADVAAEYVYAGQVSATQVTSGNLSAVVALVGSLTVGASSGRRIVLNPAGGFQVLDEDDVILVNFPTQAGSPNVFSGDGVFQGITALGRASFRGNDNEISRNSSFMLASGTTKPSNAPILELTYGQSLFVNPGGFYNGEHMYPQGDWLFAVGNDGGSGSIGASAPDRWFARWEWKQGAGGTFSRIFLPGYLRTLYTTENSRFARVGAVNIFVWWEIADSNLTPQGTNQGWYYQRFDDAGNLIGVKTRLHHPHNALFIAGGTTYNASNYELPTVGEEDGRLSLIYRMKSGADSGKLVKHLINIADGTVFSTTTSAQTYPTNVEPSGNWGIGNYDRGGSRLVLSMADVTVFASSLVRFFNPATMAEYVAEATDFGSYAGVPILWDAADSRFYSVAVGPFANPDDLTVLIKFSKNVTEDFVWVGYSWYDSDPGGTGLHETTLSPYAYIQRKKYMSLHFNNPVAPADAGDPDSPDSARFYLFTGAAEPVSEAVFREITPIVETSWNGGFIVGTPRDITLDYAVSAVAPVGVNTFPEGNAGEIVSGIGGFVVRGDGTGEWPHIEDAFDAKLALTGANAGAANRLARAWSVATLTDYDTTLDAGHYVMSGTALNRPANVLCHLEVRNFGDVYIEQVARETLTGIEYQRRKDIFGWSTWTKRKLHPSDTDWVTIGVANGWTGEVVYSRSSGVVTVHLNGNKANWGVNDAIAFNNASPASAVIPAGFRPHRLGLFLGGNSAVDNTPRTWWIEPSTGIIRAGAAGTGSIAGVATYLPGA